MQVLSALPLLGLLTVFPYLPESPRYLLVSGQADKAQAVLAKAAQVSEPTVYRHFPNKDALIQALKKSFDEQMSAGLPAGLTGLEGNLHRMRVFFRNFSNVRAIFV